MRGSDLHDESERRALAVLYVSQSKGRMHTKAKLHQLQEKRGPNETELSFQRLSKV